MEHNATTTTKKNIVNLYLQQYQLYTNNITGIEIEPQHNWMAVRDPTVNIYLLL